MYTPSTEDVRAAWYGLTLSTEPFERWLYAERERVWNMMSKIERDSERESIIKLLEEAIEDDEDQYRLALAIALIKGENK